MQWLVLWFLGTAPVPAAARPSAPFRNTAPGVAYVGSKTCSACHPDLYERFVESAMGNSMARASESGPLAKVASPVQIPNRIGIRVFRLFREDGALFQSESGPQSEPEDPREIRYRLEYVIGSGKRGQSYFVFRDGYYFEAPLSYYAAAGTWDLSPGYEAADYGFDRPLSAACLACHSGTTRLPMPTVDPEGPGSARPSDLAIGCESCHGPGGLHVDERSRALAVSGSVDTSIVNPAKLPPERAEDICMYCHQGGDARVLRPGKSFTDFRPGAPLHETLAIFVLPENRRPRRGAEVLDHHAALRLSRCYRESAGRVGCLTCHDPHHPPPPDLTAAYYRKRCLTCHTSASCKLPKRDRTKQSPVDDCTSCHMPRNPQLDIPHTALTSHRIVRSPHEPATGEFLSPVSSDVPDLVYLNGPRKPAEETLWLETIRDVYAQVMERAPEYGERYKEVSEELRRRREARR